jgi:hypothetical protein
MSLSQRIADYKPARKGGSCHTCALLADLQPKESQALADALADPRFSNAGLARILKDEGYSIASSTIGRHRRGECHK